MEISLGNLPVITMDTQSVTFLITNDNPDKITFRCKTAERADYKWITVMQDEQKIVKEVMNKTNSVYHINADLSHNGTQIFCEVTNGSGTVRSEVATITILGLHIIM